MKIDFTKSKAREAEILNVTSKHIESLLSGTGGGITLEGLKEAHKRYLIGYIEVLEDHAVALMLRFYLPNESKERLTMRFGLLPKVKTLVCFDLDLLDARTIYTNRTPGLLKLVVHGNRTNLQEVDRVELGMEKAFHDIKVRFEDFYLSDTKPEDYPLPDLKLVDEFGQWKPKEWFGKIHSFNELEVNMKAQEGAGAYPFPAWNRWGGDSSRKLKEGTGYFSRIKTDDGRWHLVDPEGYEYFSLGPCGTRPGDTYRIDHLEKFCDWLPDEEDEEFARFYSKGRMQRTPYMEAEEFKNFNFLQSNIYQVYGEKWYEKWKEISYHILMSNGINTQGNFPNLDVNNGKSKLPYVREMSGFPLTDTLIFRDFPDVLSPEYKERSELFAQQLAEWRTDNWLIGYFLRNEPEFNFVPNLCIANEVLHYPGDTYCRQGLIAFLKERYQTIDNLNKSWNSDFSIFKDLQKSIEDCLSRYPSSESDLREYSTFLIREYIKVPSLACRQVDENHLNLGLRWSEAKNRDMMVGWEYFDVFSLNCYAFDPTSEMDFVKESGVDLPIMIGEFHGGALDRGLPATGLKGVKNQMERGILWRLYVEKVAAHPYGVGAHWFQYNDQFCLGRFDGENYQIGMIDVCMQPHETLFKEVRKTSEILYQVKNGEVEAFDQMPQIIPMIGY